MEEYVSVRVSTLRGDQAIPFKVYLKIGSRHILYVRQGDAIDGDRLKKIKDKKLKRMYILPQDETSYRDYISKNIEMAYNSDSGMATESRAHIVQGHQQSQAEEVMENVEDEKVYDETKKSVSKYVDLLLNDNEILKAVIGMENKENNVAQHGVTVATYAVALAQKLNISEEQIQVLTLGCLVHDIAQHRDASLRPAKREGLSGEELELYQSHALSGANYVKDLKHFDTGVVNIIHQHEEFGDGTGYPQKLIEKNIDPLAQIAGLANTFDRLCLDHEMPKIEAAKKLMIDYVGKYPLEHLKLMQAVAKEVG